MEDLLHRRSGYSAGRTFLLELLCRLSGINPQEVRYFYAIKEDRYRKLILHAWAAEEKITLRIELKEVNEA